MHVRIQLPTPPNHGRPEPIEIEWPDSLPIPRVGELLILEHLKIYAEVKEVAHQTEVPLDDEGVPRKHMLIWRVILAVDPSSLKFLSIPDA